MKNDSRCIKAFACYSKKNKIIQNSSSGGIFFELASSVIRKLKGVVYGVVLDKTEVIHVRISTIEGLLPAMGSKYVRSNLRNTFQECKKDLINGTYVLFSGTPCQINALYSYLDISGVNKDKLIGLDVVCHGTPMKKWWDKYLEINFNNMHNYDIRFRYKKEGWSNHFIKINDYEAPFSDDPFLKAFLSNKILHESCYHCKSKGEERRSDITLGDFWGIEKVYGKLFNNKGISLVIIRNRHSFLFSLIDKTCVIKEVPYLDSVYYNNSAYYASVSKPIDCSISEHDLVNDNSIVIKKKKTSNFDLAFLVKQYIANHDSYKTTVHINKKHRKMNNKIGIITDIGYVNYGNRLQNYALITYLRKLGKKPVNIIFAPKKYTVIHYLYYFVKRRKNNNLYDKKKGIYEVSRLYECPSFVYSRTSKKQKQLCDFETIIVGSDQVWNYGYHEYMNDMEYSLGNFGIINPPFYMFSYGVSICQDSFDVENEFLFRNALANFNSLSFRENQSVNLIKTIGFDSIKVVDPTFLLSREEWINAINKYAKRQVPTKSYQLNYIFDEKNTVRYDDECEVIINDLFSGDYNQFDFINYIRNASLVVTNSFHCIVFSIIFGKKMYLKKRDFQGMESRINELLSMLGLETRYDYFYNFEYFNENMIFEIITKSKDFIIKNILG